MKILTREEAAYLAGFMDGDGSFVGQIVKQPQYVLKNQVRITVTLHQATKRKYFLDFWKKRIGGTVRDRKDGVSELNLVGRDIIMQIVPQVLPFLQIKTMQAKLILQIAERLPLTKNSPDLFLELCVLTDRISELNDSKNRTITSAVIRQEFLALGLIKE